MGETEKLNVEDLDEMSGGTIRESSMMAVVLLLAGKGAFTKNNEDRDDMVNIEGMQDYFAGKGYTFIPGFGDTSNEFIGPDGTSYNTDQMIDLIKSGKV